MKVGTAGPLGLLLVLAIVGCANNVAQDKATTPDGKITGAKPLTLVSGAATDTGIVTYPGGDRIDWKVVELPIKKQGTLEVQLKWETPRPGLQLAFDVFDQFHASAASSKANKKQSKGRTRLAAIEDAKGKYFIRVYAVGRGDAGRYKLMLTFKETVDKTTIPWIDIQIDPPRRLAELPGIVVPCDVSNPTATKACENECWPGAPKGWKGCAQTCTDVPPNPNVPICAATAPCPATPDRRFAKCTPIMFKPCPNPASPDPDNPNCDNVTAPAVYGVFTGIRSTGNESILEYDVTGTVTKAWSATMLVGGDRTNRPKNDTPFRGAKVVIANADARDKITHVTVRVTGMSPDQLNVNKWVKLSPPPPPRKNP